MQEPFCDSSYGLMHNQNPSEIQISFDLPLRIDDFQCLVFACDTLRSRMACVQFCIYLQGSLFMHWQNILGKVNGASGRSSFSLLFLHDNVS